MSEKIFIATPTKWGINPYTHLSFSYNMMELGRHTDYEILEPRMYDESPLDEARNQSVTEFLENTDADIWVTYDADQVFKKGDFVRLLGSMVEAGVDVVSGWYLARKGTGTVVVFRRKDGKVLCNFDDFSYYTPYTVTQLTHLPKTQTNYGNLAPVDGVGAGLLAVRREVLERMEYPYFLQWSPVMKRDVHHFGEDLWFCDKLAQLEISIYVNLKCFIGHWASQGYVVADLHLRRKMLQEGVDLAKLS